jgi:steroid delta-isomerase-like uncharacterized protein
MTPEQNRAVIERHHDRLNAGDIASALTDFAEDTRNHGRTVGRDGVRRVLTDIYETFPDYRLDILDIIAVSDSVVVRVKNTGTHRGMGRVPVQGGIFFGVPPIGKHYEVQHMHWYKLRDGKIVEHFASRDDVGQMQQLGMLPPPSQGATPPSTR